jgi:glutamate racemase
MVTIGVFDSGVGGLSILREIHAQHPRLHTLYYADQAHLPYGPRDPAQVRDLLEAAAGYLLAQGAQTLVIACHTACAAGLHTLRARFPHVPIVGIEPAVKPAAAASKSGVIGVLTTEGTAKSDIYASVIRRFAAGVRVITEAAPDWVLLVEQGAADNALTRAVIARRLEPLLAEGADQIVLACTHYPFLLSYITLMLGERAEVVDPSPAVARQVGRVVQTLTVQPAPNKRASDGGTGPLSLKTGTAQGERRYFTTGDARTFEGIAAALLGQAVSAEGVVL